MANEPTASILVDLDASPALKSLESFAQEFNSGSQAIASGLEPMKAAWTGMTNVIGTVLDVTSKWADAAAEAEKIERGLASAFKLRGDGFGVITQRTIAYNNQLEKTLGIDAELLATQQKRLLAMGVEAGKIQDATKATIGLAEVTGSLDSAARLVGRAYDGNFEALRRWGIEAKSSEEAIQKSIELFSLAEEGANTYAGRIEKLERAYERLDEGLGNTLIHNESINRSIENMTTIVDTSTPFLTRFFDAVTGRVLSDTPGAASDLASLPGWIQIFSDAISGQMEPALESATPDARAFADQLARIADFDMTKWIGTPFLLPGQTGLTARPQAATQRAPRAQTSSSASTLPASFGGFSFSSLEGIEGSPFSGGIDPNIIAGFEAGTDQLVEAATARQDELFEIQDRWIAEQYNAASELKAIDEQQAIDKAQFYGNMVAITANGVFGMVSEISSGRKKVGPAIAKLFGTLAAQIIPPLITMATTTTASGAASSTLGTPAAIVAGPILAGAVSAFAAAVGSLGATTAARGDNALASARAGRLPSFTSYGATRNQGQGFRPSAAPREGLRASGNQIFNITFSQVLPGSEDQIARNLQRLMNRGSRLNPGGN